MQTLMDSNKGSQEENQMYNQVRCTIGCPR